MWHLWHPALSLRPTDRTERCSRLRDWHPTSHRSCSNHTGYQNDIEWNLSSLLWSTWRSTTWHHRIRQTIASYLPQPGAVSFDHQTISNALSLVPVHVLEIEHSLLPDHVFGTVFLHTSVYFVFGNLPSQSENVFNYPRHQRLVTLAFRRCVHFLKLTFTYLYKQIDLDRKAKSKSFWALRQPIPCPFTSPQLWSSEVWKLFVYWTLVYDSYVGMGSCSSSLLPLAEYTVAGIVPPSRSLFNFVVCATHKLTFATRTVHCWSAQL